MKKFVVVCCLLLSFMLGACCAGTVSAEQNAPIKIWAQNTNGSYRTLCVVDEETGVNYIVVSTELPGSHRSIAITPRYTAEGTLYIEHSKEER